MYAAPDNRMRLTHHYKVFHPSSNRLSGFLKISNLFVALAPTGGLQYKAGFLHVNLTGNGAGIGRRSTRNARKELRWCAVHESYLVIVEDSGEVCPSVPPSGSDMPFRRLFWMFFFLTLTSPSVNPGVPIDSLLIFSFPTHAMLTEVA